MEKSTVRPLDVSITRDLDLCVSCEMCPAVCPVGAIIMEEEGGQFLPKVDKEKCTECGLCLELCTGIDPDPLKLRDKKILNRSFDSACLECYTAYSNNKSIRENSVSGGLITNLIIELIKNKDFDSVFVLSFDRFDSRPARLQSTNKIDEIFNAAKSKYIPASVYDVIKTLQNKDSKKYIVIATPCLIYGIKKFIKKNALSEENLLFLGLFCEKTLNFNAERYFKDVYKKPNEKLTKLEFRTKEKYGWPGNSKIYFDSGRQVIINRQVRMQLKKYFQLNRCLFCLDRLNRFADVSFGDYYIKEKSDTKGKSSVIVRTKKGKEIFDKYAHLFTLNRESIEKIHSSQNLRKKRENLEYLKVFNKKNNVYPVVNTSYEIDLNAASKLSKAQKYIKWGKDYDVKQIRKAMRFSAVPCALDFIKTKTERFIETFTKRNNKNKDVPQKIDKGNIIIVGGGFLNKGAQAMTFTVVDQIKRRFPDKEIYLFSRLDFRREEKKKNIYAFNILPWNLATRISLLYSWTKLFTNVTKYGYLQEKMKKIVKDADCVIDISGYALSSQWSVLMSISYLMNIMFAKKYKIPYYIFPQSIGPLNYPLVYKIILYPLMKSLLRYPQKIFVREEEGLKWVHKFTKDNVEKSYDIVFQSQEYNVGNIYKESPRFKDIKIKQGSICIIPSLRVIERADSVKINAAYQMLIKRLIEERKRVYILRHSWEDLGVCESIVRPFSNNEAVELIHDELNAIELENIIKQCDFIIASRYHSVIHAYKNGVSALVIGWADKYFELLKEFNQLDYFIDCRDNLDVNTIQQKLNKILEDYKDEAGKIIGKMSEDKKQTIFDEVFNSLNQQQNIKTYETVNYYSRA